MDRVFFVLESDCDVLHILLLFEKLAHSRRHVEEQLWLKPSSAFCYLFTCSPTSLPFESVVFVLLCIVRFLCHVPFVDSIPCERPKLWMWEIQFIIYISIILYITYIHKQLDNVQYVKPMLTLMSSCSLYPFPILKLEVAFGSSVGLCPCIFLCSCIPPGFWVFFKRDHV